MCTVQITQLFFKMCVKFIGLLTFVEMETALAKESKDKFDVLALEGKQSTRFALFSITINKQFIFSGIPEVSKDDYITTLKRFDQRLEVLQHHCIDINKSKRLMSGHHLGLQVPEAQFLVCAPWKSSSTYWREFTESLIVSSNANRYNLRLINSINCILLYFWLNHFVSVLQEFTIFDSLSNTI